MCRSSEHAGSRLEGAIHTLRLAAPRGNRHITLLALLAIYMRRRKKLLKQSANAKFLALNADCDQTLVRDQLIGVAALRPPVRRRREMTLPSF